MDLLAVDLLLASDHGKDLGVRKRVLDKLADNVCSGDLYAVSQQRSLWRTANGSVSRLATSFVGHSTTGTTLFIAFNYVTCGIKLGIVY